MDINIISQNIKNNIQDYTAEQIKKLFEDYAQEKSDEAVFTFIKNQQE